MNTWNHYLLAQGARATDERLPDFGRALGTAELADGFVAPITDLGLIAISGDDAASFLHGQLTNDVEHLGADQVRLAAYCSPKGRVMASFLMWRTPDSIYLELSRNIQPAIQKRLSMFVLRAKAKLRDAAAEPATQVILGLGGARAGAVLGAWFPALPGASYTKVSNEAGTLLRVADLLGVPRYQWLLSEEQAQAAWPALSAGLTVGGSDAWNLSEIHAGVARIELATQEQFVPQMINYELLGGVNFKKGCYPGQEIVARSQYLGKLKRRTALLSIADPAAKAGSEVFTSADPDQPAGMVVNSAPNGHGGVDALVELKLAAIEGGVVKLGSATGADGIFLQMPYPLDALDL